MTATTALDKSPALLADLGIVLDEFGGLMLTYSVRFREFLEQARREGVQFGVANELECPLARYLDEVLPTLAPWCVGTRAVDSAGGCIALSPSLHYFIRRYDAGGVLFEWAPAERALEVVDELVLEGFE